MAGPCRRLDLLGQARPGRLSAGERGKGDARSAAAFHGRGRAGIARPCRCRHRGGDGSTSLAEPARSCPCEAPGPPPVIVEFPTMEEARAWDDSPVYRDARRSDVQVLERKDRQDYGITAANPIAATGLKPRRQDTRHGKNGWPHPAMGCAGPRMSKRRPRNQIFFTHTVVRYVALETFSRVIRTTLLKVCFFGCRQDFVSLRVQRFGKRTNGNLFRVFRGSLLKLLRCRTGRKNREIYLVAAFGRAGFFAVPSVISVAHRVHCGATRQKKITYRNRPMRPVDAKRNRRIAVTESLACMMGR